MTTTPPTPESVIAWHRECFRTEAADAPLERVKRFLEEALEAAQSGDLTRAEAHALVDYVFDRPRDPDIGKELGGVYTTAVILARAMGLDFWECACKEFARCEGRTEEIRRKQATKPDHVRGDIPPSD